MDDLAFRDLRFHRLGAMRSGTAFSPVSLFANGEAGDAWVADRDWCYTKSGGGVYERVTTSGDIMARWKGMANGINADQDDVAKRPAYMEGSGTAWGQYDGVNDGLSTPNIDFTNTDKISVFTSSTTSVTNDRSLIELGGNYNSKDGLRVSMPSQGINSSASGVTGYKIIVSGGISMNTPYIVASNMTRGSTTPTGRLNRTQAMTVSRDDILSGNYGNLYLSVGSREGTTLFHGGRIYGLVLRGALSNLTEIAATENYLAELSGVTL